MTKGHIKKGKAGGKHLSTSCGQSLADKNDKQAAALFAEFAKAFRANGSCPGRMA